MKPNAFPLFPEPPHNGTDTSRAAAESVRPYLNSVRGKVYNRIVESGEEGATCDELQEALGLLPQTCSARCNDLKKAKLIVDSGKRRPTKTGRSAMVYVAANEKGQDCHPGQMIDQKAQKSEGSTE